MDEESVFVAGATGFVGQYLYPALAATGATVRCGARSLGRARAQFPGRRWVHFDLERTETLAPALDGCNSAFYLVHSMAAGAGYPQRELGAAKAFREAAEQAGLQRIVYLGGVVPSEVDSPHLASRAATGEQLRAGAISTIELRAAMIIGAGSLSWQIVRDLGVRLPAMILPRWLRNHSWPLGIEDVVFALLAGWQLPAEGSRWFDIPGPERLSYRQLLQRVADHVGHHPPMVNVPLLSPRLSSYWIGLVTRADLVVARELVEGLRHDLDPSGELLWERFPDYERMPVDEAIEGALGDERSRERPTQPTWARLQRIGQIVRTAA